MESTLNELKDYLQSIKQKLQNRNDDDDDNVTAMELISAIILKIEIGPMLWFDIEKQFFDLIEVSKPLNQIVDAIKSNPQNEATKDALKKVNEAIDELNRLKNLLTTNASEQAQITIEIIEKIKTKVNANPDNFAAELLELEDEFRKALLDTFKVSKTLTNLLETDYLEAMLHIWSAQVAVESLKTTHPSEADQLKHIFNDIEMKFYSLRKFTRNLLNKIKWRMNQSKSNDEEPPEEVHSIEKCDMYTNVCTVEDLSEPVQEDKRDSIAHLNGVLEAKSSEILEHINHVTEKFKSKYPEDNELKSYVEEKKIQFIDMKDGIGTIANKIELDAQNRSPDGEELAGFYTDMFLYVLKAKVLTFLDIRLSQLNLHELAPVREENLDPKQEFMEEIHGRKGSLSEFTFECFQHFSIESMLVNEMQGNEYEYLEYL